MGLDGMPGKPGRGAVPDIAFPKVGCGGCAEMAGCIFNASGLAGD